MKNRTIRFDWAIKDLLRKKENFGILEGFLNELLKDVIHIKEVLESIKHESVIIDDRIDVLVTNSKNKLMVVEIQIYKEMDYLERLQYGVSKTIGQLMDQSEKSNKIKSVCSISILYFDFEQASDYIYYGTTSLKGVHNGQLLALSNRQETMFIKAYPTDLFAEHYLLNVKRFDDTIKDALDSWIYYLKKNKIKQVAPTKGLSKAMQTLDELNMSAQDLRTYDRFLENQMSDQSILETARIEGNWAGKTEMILVGFKKGLTVEFLADIADMKLEWVQSILQKNQELKSAIF